MAVKQLQTYCRVCIATCGLVVDIDVDPLTGMVGYSGFPVGIEPAESDPDIGAVTGATVPTGRPGGMT